MSPLAKYFALGTLLVFMNIVPVPGQSVAKTSPSRLDSSGDPLPAGAIARLGTVRFRIGNAIHGLAWSPDGKVLAARTWHDHIHLLDARSGRRLRHFQADVWSCRQLLFSPDSRFLAIIGQRAYVQLWEVASGKLRRQFEMPQSRGFSLAFSHDGKTLAAGPEDAKSNTSIYVWEMETAKQLARIEVLPNYMVSVALSPDGRTVASWGQVDSQLPGGHQHRMGEVERTIQLWDVQSGKEIRKVSYDCGRVSKVAFSPDGRTLAAVNMLEWPAKAKEGESCTINLWDLPSGKERCRYPVPRDSYFETFSYAADGHLSAAREENNNLQLWEGTTGKLLGSYRQPNCAFRCLSFRADGTILACGEEHSSAIRIWDVRSGKVLNADVQGHSSPVTGLAFCADDPALMTVSHEGRLCTWETARGTQLKSEMVEDTGSSGYYRPSPDGRYLTCQYGFGQDYIWKSSPGQGVSDRRRLPTSYNGSLAFSADGSKFATNSVDKQVLLWESKTGRKLCGLACREGDLGSLGVSSDGSKLAATNKIELPAGQSRFQVLVWDALTTKELACFPVEGVSPPVFSPDDKLLAMVCGPDIEIWDLAARKHVRGIPIGHRPRDTLTFSPDGNTVAISTDEDADGDSLILLFEWRTGEVRRQFRVHQGRPLCLAFSRDGRLLASGSTDTTAMLWDVTGLWSERGLPALHLQAVALDALWRDMQAADAGRAYQALWTMVASPDEAVPFLRSHVRVRTPVDPIRVAQAIANLDSKEFATRQKATDELEQWEELAEPLVHKALQSNPSLEARSRLERVLEKLSSTPSTEQLGALRGLEVLEHVGTQKAKELLSSLAMGPPEARVTQEAKASLGRLVKHSPGTP
jgi:WD40 repeat protein